MDALLDLGGLVGIAIGVAGVVAVLSNRRIKDERAQFVEKQRDDYREALETERIECAAKITEQGERISRLEGQLELANSEHLAKLAEDVGNRVGDRIGTAILHRISERGIG